MAPDTSTYLFLGYTIFWLVLAGYLIHLGRVHHRLRATLRSLEGEIAGPIRRTVQKQG